MNPSHSLRCLFASVPKPLPDLARCLPRRYLHSSSRRRRDDHDRPSKQVATTPSRSPARSEPKATAEHFPVYTAEERAKLSQKYTPAQIAAIEAGEAAIDPNDIATQGVVRRDPMSLRYIDDFSRINPVIDNPVRAPEENYDPHLRYKEDEELGEDLTRLVESVPGDVDWVELTKFLDRTRLMVGDEEAELNPRSYEAPELPKLTDPVVRRAARLSALGQNDDDNTVHFQRLTKQTGMSVLQMKHLRIKNLVSHRVVNQTRMGKVQSLYFLTVAGNGKGLLGIGEGKAVEPEDARRQAQLNAIRNLTPIPRYEERTIFGDVKGKVGATELELYTRPPGFGIRCQDKIYEMCKCAGINDLSARVTRSRNPMNTVKAAMKALLSQRIPEEIARARGKKLVDVRKVYYGGQV